VVKSSQESSVLFNPHFSFQLYDDLHMFVQLHFVILLKSLSQSSLSFCSLFSFFFLVLGFLCLAFSPFYSPLSSWGLLLS
jgi:hypothetical protein